MRRLFSLAIRNVLRNRRRTAITLAALVVGIGVTVAINGLLAAIQRASLEGVVFGQTGAIQVHRKGYMDNILASPLNLTVPADEAFLSRIRAVPGVSAVAARISFPGLVNVGEETLFLSAFAVDPKEELRVVPLRLKSLNPGATFPGVELADGVLLTTELARAIDGKVGAVAALLSSDVDGVLSGELIHLAGTMNLNLPGEKKVGLVPLQIAQRLLKLDGKATELAIAVKDLDDVRAVAVRLRAALGPGSGGGTSAYGAESLGPGGGGGFGGSTFVSAVAGCDGTPRKSCFLFAQAPSRSAPSPATFRPARSVHLVLPLTDDVRALSRR